MQTGTISALSRLSWRNATNGILKEEGGSAKDLRRVVAGYSKSKRIPHRKLNQERQARS